MSRKVPLEHHSTIAGMISQQPLDGDVKKQDEAHEPECSHVC